MDILHHLRESGEAMLARAGFVLIEANEVQGVAFLTARARDGDGIWLLLFARSQEALRTSGILHGVDTVKAQLPARVEVRVTLLTPEPFDEALPYEQMSLADLRRGAEPQQGVRVDTLSVFSTGVFNDLKLRFPAQGPAVLVGQNARGKSTLLRALARALSWWVAEAERPGQEGAHADDLDIYRSAPESRVGFLLSLGPSNVAWSIGALPDLNLTGVSLPTGLHRNATVRCDRRRSAVDRVIQELVPGRPSRTWAPAARSAMRERYRWPKRVSTLRPIAPVVLARVDQRLRRA